MTTCVDKRSVLLISQTIREGIDIMYRITSMTTNGKHSGKWRVLDGDHHEPTRVENPNLFFPTLQAARAKCRSLNK